MWMSKEATQAYENDLQTDEYWIVRTQLDFAKELNKIKNNTNISGKTLAQKLGTSAAYISRVLRGDTNLTIESMVKFARAIGANVEIKLTPMETVAETPVATHSCQVFDIPTPMMKALTKQKQEVSKSHVFPKFVEQYFSKESGYLSAEDNMALMVSGKAFGENTMWHAYMQQLNAPIAKKA